MCLLGEASRGRLRVLLIHLDAVSSAFISENLSIEIQLFSWRFDRHSFCLCSFLFVLRECLSCSLFLNHIVLFVSLWLGGVRIDWFWISRLLPMCFWRYQGQVRLALQVFQGSSQLKSSFSTDSIRTSGIIPSPSP